MGNSTIKNARYLSASNKSAIFNLLRSEGPTSRADISRRLNLSFPAVTANVKELIRAGVVKELGAGTNTVGRKSVLLSLNEEKAYFMGVDIGRRNLRAMCTDILGNVLSYNSIPLLGHNIYDKLLEIIHRTAADAKVGMEDVVSIGVGIPGIYDAENDKHILAPLLESWGDVSIMKHLHSHFDQDIYLENSVNLGAVGERWVGMAQGCDDLVYLDFGVGFGSAIVMNGELVKGKNGAAGEIAYITLERSFLREKYSDEGALEQLIPGFQISRIAARMEQNGELNLDIIEEELKSYLSPLFTENIPVYFAMAIINVVALFNPEIVIIAGRLGCAIYNKYKERIDALIKAHVLFFPTIECTALREKANVYGAVALAAEHYNTDYHKFLK